MGGGNPIPTRSRTVVAERDRRLCVRCTGPGTDLHHRRRRSVRDVHQHCACNLVTLCRTCHSWAHAHPTAAAEHGYIVMTWIDQPREVGVRAWWGWVEMDCEGEATWFPGPSTSGPSNEIMDNKQYTRNVTDPVTERKAPSEQ